MNRVEKLTYALRALMFVQREAGDKWVQGSELTRQQAFTLGYLAEHEGEGVIARELSELFNVTPASVTSLLQGIEERGLITRTASPKDARIKHIHTTTDGRRLIQGFDDAMRAAQDHLFDPLTDAEQDQLLQLVTKLVDAAGIDIPTGPPRTRPDTGR